MSFSRAPLQWTVNVTNSADLGGSCAYHVVTSCTGDFGGQPVEFGHDEQDVSL